MSDTIIQVENLGKKYLIGNQTQERYTALRDVITKKVKTLGNFMNPKSKISHYQNEFWALRDISFDIKQGDRVAIIGRNGAGKSTLLKVISRITEPTKGRIKIKGRVASLLEVGTGFHPELTGRENIYLNGAILGMSNIEIKKKFDEIVEFAEVAKFLDTPVKRYSSGMYVRLAFAVAANLEPEVLVIDEVLAVGDARFQQKCINKMEEIGTQGRTILFVSHNIGIVQSLCTRGILLNNGTVQENNSIDATIKTYLELLEQASTENLLDRTDRRGKGQVRLKNIEVISHSNMDCLLTNKPASFIFHLTDKIDDLNCIFTIYNDLGQSLAHFNSSQSTLMQEEKEASAKLVCDIENLPLLPGRYRINVQISGLGQVQDHLEGATFFEVEASEESAHYLNIRRSYGDVYMKHEWVRHN